MNRRRAASPAAIVANSWRRRATGTRSVAVSISSCATRAGNDRLCERDLIGGGEQRVGSDLVEVTAKKICLVTTCRLGVGPCHRGRG